MAPHHVPNYSNEQTRVLMGELSDHIPEHIPNYRVNGPRNFSRRNMCCAEKCGLLGDYIDSTSEGPGAYGPRCQRGR